MAQDFLDKKAEELRRSQAAIQEALLRHLLRALKKLLRTSKFWRRLCIGICALGCAPGCHVLLESARAPPWWLDPTFLLEPATMCTPTAATTAICTDLSEQSD